MNTHQGVTVDTSPEHNVIRYSTVGSWEYACGIGSLKESFDGKGRSCSLGDGVGHREWNWGTQGGVYISTWKG